MAVIKYIWCWKDQRGGHSKAPSINNHPLLTRPPKLIKEK